jgi:hypothetical protein
LMLYLGNLPDTLVNLVVYHREQRKDHVASSVDLYPYAKWQQNCYFTSCLRCLEFGKLEFHVCAELLT